MMSIRFGVFFLFALLSLAFAQDTGQSLPQCALNCMNDLIPLSTCAATDQVCICNNSDLQTQLTACVTANCTVKQALSTQNYTATACSWPDRDQSGTLRHVSIPLAVVATLFVAARIAARLPALDGKFGLDDWFILVAWLLSIGFTILLNMLSYSGLGKDVWTLPFNNITETLKIFTVLEKVYIPTVWITKISILFLYLRLFPNQGLRRQIKIGLGLCAATVVCLETACIFKCWPVSFSWNYWDGEHQGKCSSMAAQGWANSGLNTFGDIVVLVLPLPTIWKLKLPMEKKLGIIAMFSVGLFLTVVSIVRMKTMKYFTFSANATWDFVQLSLWSAIEIYVGIMCASMPGMRAFYTRIFRGRKWEKTSASHGYPAVGSNNQRSANQTFGSSNPRLKHKTSVKSEFELSVTEADSTEDLTTRKEEPQVQF